MTIYESNSRGWMTIVIANPGELHGRPAVSLVDAIVDVRLQRPDNHGADLVGAELDVSLLEKIKRVVTPQIGVNDTPSTGPIRHGLHSHGKSTSPRSAATTAAARYFNGSMPCSLAVSRIVYSVAATWVPRRDFEP